MTGDNMKSDIIDDSKLKIEGRQSLHRGRMPKNSPHTQAGERTTMELTLSRIEAFGENFQKQSAKQNEMCDTIEARKCQISEADVCTASTMVVDELLVGKAAGEAQETEHLKDLLLLHLDLIHQQQELLSMKDRQLKSIKSENEALKCRLERMERRMSILKQKESHSQMPSGSDMTPIKTDMSNRGVKRKLDTESPRKFSENSQKRVRNDKIHNLSRRQQSLCDKDIRTVKYSALEESDDTPVDKIKLQKLLGSCDKKCVDDGLLRTDIMYYVPPHLEVVEEITPCPVKECKQSGIEVPSWRLNPVSRYYNLEGTENLEDEVFLKRHQKPEIDERRRKRWDSQRLREQRMYEKLQSGRYNENKCRQEMQEQTTFSSFCPNIDEIDYIEVCETIPVCAFGFPIPNLKPAEFELPWFDLEKRDREEKMKAARKKR